MATDSGEDTNNSSTDDEQGVECSELLQKGEGNSGAETQICSSDEEHNDPKNEGGQQQAKEEEQEQGEQEEQEQEQETAIAELYNKRYLHAYDGQPKTIEKINKMVQDGTCFECQYRAKFRESFLSPPLVLPASSICSFRSKIFLSFLALNVKTLKSGKICKKNYKKSYNVKRHIVVYFLCHVPYSQLLDFFPNFSP